MNEGIFNKYMTAGALGLASMLPMSDVEAKETPKPAVEYVVKSGDNLGKIAKKHGTTVENLIKLNGLKDPNKIKPGQKLKITSQKKVEKKAETKKTPEKPSVPVVEKSVYDTLVEFCKQVENSKSNKKGGWNEAKKRWFMHDSFEGGNPTIAHGHKVNDTENIPKYRKGLTDPEADVLLISDLKTHAEKTIRDYESMTKGKWNDLKPEAKAILIEKCFNVGSIRKFPSLTAAIKNNDVDGIIKNYSVKGLTTRSALIRSKLVEPLIIKIKAENQK